MKLQLLLQYSEDGKVFDVSNLAEAITVTKSVDGTAR